MNSTPALLSRREFVKVSAMTGAAAAVSGCVTNPVTGQSQLMLISQSGEIALDRESSPKQFSADYGAMQDAAVTSYVAGVGQGLTAHAHRKDMPYSFRPVNAVYCNAYAFPGGSIAVTRGMLAELEDESQLAALLSHEVAHVNYRHTAQQMTKGLLAELAIAGAGVYLGSRDKDRYAEIVTMLGGLGATMYLAKYSRAHEREADRTGMDYMAAAGYDPGGMVDLMKLLVKLSEGKDGGAVSTLFATHPMSTERLNTASFRLATAYPPDPNRKRNRDAFQAGVGPVLSHREPIRRMCRGEEALGKEKPAEARALIEEGLRGMPDDYAGLLLLARVAQAQDRQSEAEELARRAASVYPQEAQSRAVLAQSLYAQKRYDTALAALHQYDQMLPGDPTVPFYAGLCHERMGNRQAATQSYARFLNLAGTNTDAPPVQHAVGRLRAWGVIAP
ncbi:MAG: M48 family metalloprotease [Kiritimatiellae bacterium]|nr:M48 family metalloprotease [Kiritimatiellia bacterium]